MNENNLVPNIRFKGFEAEWEKKKLRKYIKKVSGNDGRINLPTLTISATKGWMNQKERFSRNIAGKEQKNYTLLKKGELSYNHGNSRIFKYGIVYELTNYDEALVPKVYHSFKVNLKASAKFIEYLFRGKKADHELRKLVTSGARLDGLLNISFSNFESIQLYFPKKNEQEKIGNFFAKLDKLFDLQQQKIDKLELLKKALLQKLFPKHETKVPELRFKGYEEDWKKTRIGKIVQYSNSTYSIKDLKQKKEGKSYSVYDATGRQYYSSSFDMTKEYIAIIKDGTNVGTVKLLPAKTSVLSTMAYLDAQDSDIVFDYYVFKNLNFKKYKVGSGIPHIYFSDYKMQVEFIPQLPEQQKIGNLLSKVDQLIESENKKLQDFQQVKKCLLQNMFVE